MTDEIELTATSYIVLGLLERLGEASPYELKQAVAETVANFWSVPHSQVYREAGRLTRAGYLSERRERTAGGRPRRVHALTARGRRALEAWRETTSDELPQLRDPGLLRLFFGADPAAIGRVRLDAHRRQLDGYEARRAVAGDSMPAGPRLALEAGIGHEREWVRFWSRLAGEAPPAGA
jgi:PadR family transcriptional regulator, regulatory protein AphA